MTTLKIMVQNIRGATMGSEKRGGNIAPLRLRVHNAKQDVIIVTETRIEDREYDGRGFLGDINHYKIVPQGEGQEGL